METPKKGRRALVLGGGIAGLAAAGVASRHFEEVVVIERDPYPDEPAVRPHAAQGAHVHILLAKGLDVLASLIPELPGWLDEMGLSEGDLTRDLRMAYGGRWLPQIRSGIPFRPCTRPEIEHLLRKDVARRSNVRVWSDHKALGLLGGDRITGVSVSHDGVTRDVLADLVVDAMGRASPSAKWLSDAGTAPRIDALDAGVVYSSCLFEPPAKIDDDWIMMAVSAQVPTDPHMGAVMRLGPDRMLCAFIAYGKPRPPGNAAEFVERTKTLCVPEVHRLLSASKPISDVTVFANTQNRWRHYGLLPRFPEGLVCIGDAVCTLNPRYGQGMTVAALSAERLDAELSAHFHDHRHLAGFSTRFQRRLEDVLTLPWQMALMEDKLWVSAFSGNEPTVLERITKAASERVLRAVFSDMEAFIRFMRVAHLIDAPAKLLMSPTFLGAVARGGAKSAAPVPPPKIGGAVS